ncbi:DNA polymerase (family 10) [Scopulibacillus darangshiensis]|uniref:DNA-directed DNA polymerase n=1 Tax=Scopulibacillus darangshiensis TaxID=442528 RepID=A0A4V2SNR9_9BACL|nr:DNA polymerase/3'-5' exonuclease PolX [Scopulibacillus darangshiensis]TCP32126.1 DNA polymerase (family 10) [Scopulibacillus darangshiensis]
MNKKQIIKVLEAIAIYLEIKGENPFKISAYRKAAQALETDDRSMVQIDDPSKLKGIGKGTAQVIQELLDTGESELLKELQEDIPEGLLKLLKLPGLGGKKIGKLYQLLGVVDMDSLKQACAEERVQHLEGFGKKTEGKILKAIEEFNIRPDRLPVSYMLPLAEQIEKILGEIDSVERYSRAGSLRRLKELIKDLDFVIATKSPEEVAKELAERLNIKDITGQGSTKMSVVLNDDYEVSIDFRFVQPKAFVSTLHHFTGSKDHNVKLRQLAKKNDEKISEYGVENNETGEIYTFSSETAFFNHFGLNYIPPEAREGITEIEEASKGHLDVISLDQIKSDLHMHTTWSDGAYTIKEMVEAAKAKGYEYIVITDHSKSLRVAGGLTAERLKQQREEIDQLNEADRDFKIFAGVEMDILPDGSLDYDDDVLASLDFVIGAIHSSFSQDREKIMTRLTNACENPYVRLIAHPTGRIIGGRKGYDVDLAGLIDVAKKTGTALELNANPNRLDLSAEWVKKAQEAGVNIAINTDAHSIDMLHHMTVGVSTAIKGLISSKNVLNTMARPEFEAFLKEKRRL